MDWNKNVQRHKISNSTNNKTITLQSFSFAFIFQKKIYICLGVTSWARGQRFADSKTAEVDWFFQDLKIPSTSPRGGTLSCGSRVWDFRLVKEHLFEKDFNDLSPGCNMFSFSSAHNNFDIGNWPSILYKFCILVFLVFYPNFRNLILNFMSKNLLNNYVHFRYF